MRTLITIVIVLYLQSSFASECESIWNNEININRDADILYEEIKKLSLYQGTPVIATPKALKTALHGHSPARSIHQMNLININGWTIIYSHDCDKAQIIELQKKNNDIVKNYSEKSSKKFKMDFYGLEISDVLKSFTYMCGFSFNTLIKQKDNIKISLSSEMGKSNCNDLTAILSANGMWLEVANKKLVVNWPNKNFN
jgi:hypothetical protein